MTKTKKITNLILASFFAFYGINSTYSQIKPNYNLPQQNSTNPNKKLIRVYNFIFFLPNFSTQIQDNKNNNGNATQELENWKNEGIEIYSLATETVQRVSLLQSERTRTKMSVSWWLQAFAIFQRLQNVNSQA